MSGGGDESLDLSSAKKRHPSNREIRRLLLADKITELHLASRSTYGTRRMQAALFHESGLVVNRKLVKKLMRAHGLFGLPAKKKGTRNLAHVATSSDFVNRNFAASSLNTLWLTDITEHKTREGTLYCCVVLDLCSRRVVRVGNRPTDGGSACERCALHGGKVTYHLTFHDSSQRPRIAIHLLEVHPEPQTP